MPKALRYAGEVVAAGLVVLSPWPFASNEPGYEYLITLGILALTALWIAHALVVGRLTFRPDVVSVALAGLVLVSAGQLVPLPESVVGVISPKRLEYHRTLVPAVTESLPGGGGGVARATSLPLTVDVAATRTFLGRCLGLLLLYAAVRNWLANRGSLTRFAWLMAGVGTPLALLALLDLFAGEPGRVLWAFPIDRQASATYGPFVCRNHYPDFAYFALGLSAALAWPRGNDAPARDATSAAWLTPNLLALMAVTVLVAVSIPFSMSRGGLIAGIAAGGAAWLLARTRPAKEITDRPSTAGRLALAALGIAGFLGVAWVGTGLLEARYATLAGPDATSSRLPLWRDAVRLVPQFWAAGSGDGTFVYVEGTVRKFNPIAAMFFFDSAHNEYLEALIEGGVVRLALTLLLAFGPLVVIARGYRDRHHRTVGPHLLAVWFALAALALHSAVDFGVHMPAVAVVAAVAAGLGMAAAVDTGFVPTRVRVRRVRSADAVVTIAEPNAPIESPTALRDPAWYFRGPTTAAVGIVLALASLAVAADTRARATAERFRRDAETMFWQTRDPDRLSRRAALYAERAKLLPGDGAALFDAGLAALDAAAFGTWTPGAAVVGGPLGFLNPAKTPPPAVIAGPLREGVAWLQLARAANPMQPRVHARLAVSARFLPGGEPAAAHFARAKTLLPDDPDVWFASGSEALARGDVAAATADYAGSLAAGPNHVAAIVAALKTRLGPDAIRAALPRDPVALLAAVAELFPDRLAQAAERAPFLQDALSLAEGRTDLTPPQVASLAECYDELDRPEEAAALMLRLYADRPNDPAVLDLYARFLESNDRFSEAVTILEVLRRRTPQNRNVMDRLEAARHSALLLAEIRGG